MDPNRRPIILSTFSIGVIWQTWVNYYAGIWYVDFKGIYSFVASELSFGIETKTFDAPIGNVQENGVHLTEVLSIALLQSEPSFYWDDNNKILYIRLKDFDPPSTSIMKVGIASINIATETYIDYVNGTTYLPDLKNIPPLAQNKDRLFFKKIQNRIFSMIVNNANLTYDDIKDWDIYNQKVQYYFGYHDQLFSEFQKIRSGLIRDFSFSGDDLNINIQDIRSLLTARIPTNTFTIAKYPDLDPDFSGDMIPLSFGTVKNAPIKVVNSEHATGPYIYKIADTEISPIHAINQVYVDGVSVTHSGENLADATFTLTGTQVKDGTAFKEVTCDHEGYEESGSLIENPLDIIVYLLANYLSIPYNNVRYNTIEWALERTGKSPVAKYIASKIQIKTVIEELTTSIRGGFFDEGDARFTFRTVNVDQTAAIVIRDSDWIDTPDVSIDTTEMLAFVRIGYNKDYGKNKQKTIQDTEDKANVEQSFGIYDDETFNTLLRDKTDAEDLAADIMDLSNSPAIIVKGKTGLENAFAKIGKIFSVDVNRFVDGEYQEWYGNLTGEILSVAPDILNETTEVILRVIPGAGAEEEFAAAIYGIGIYGLTMYGVTK